MKKEYLDHFFRALTELNKSEKARDIQENLKGERYLMLYLNDHGGSASPGDICESLGVTNARVAAITKALEKKQFITRQTDEIDRRRIVIKMTDTGSRFVKQRLKEFRQKVSHSLDLLGEEDTAELLRILDRMIELERDEKK